MYTFSEPYLVITQQNTCAVKSYGLPMFKANSACNNFMVMVNHFNNTIADKFSVFWSMDTQHIIEQHDMLANETKCNTEMRNTLNNATSDNM